jgi:hypothetical protein
MVARAGWALTTERVAEKPEGFDVAALLEVIEAEMKDSPALLQWGLNHRHADRAPRVPHSCNRHW